MISLVVPTYKERQNIEPLVARTGAAMLALGEPFELIIVDDDSPDGTGDEVRRLQATRPWLKLLVRQNERDLSTAVIAGWRIAQGDVLGCMDADLQHPPEKLAALVERLHATNADIVIGSRHVKGGGVSNWSLLRRFVSWTATLMATCILPGTLGKALDPMSGFFLVRRRVIERVALNPIGYKILLEVLARGDYNTVEEVPYIFEEREKGGSKMSSKTVWYYLGHLTCLSFETGEATRIVKYALVGLTGAVINFSLARYLHEPLGWSLEAASLPAIAAAILNNFIWNDLFTFPEARKAAPGIGSWLRRLLSFSFFSATGALLNLGILSLLHLVAGFPKTLSLVVAIAIAGVFNFFVNSNVTWRAWWNRKLLSRTQAQETTLNAQQMQGMAFIPCNYCGSTEYKVLYPGNADKQGDIAAQAFRCTSEEHGDFTNIVQCSQCGLLFENPREVETVSDKKYQDVEDPTYDLETPGRIRTFSKLMDGLQQYATKPGKMLDIGCYTGVFLDVAKSRGWETHGVEPSRWASRKAQSKGHQVINAPLQKAGLAPESFDMVTIWDVIEHLQDPQGQLKLAFDLLKPGGVFGLSTMDVGCMFAKVTGRHWPWYMRMHFYYFSAASMARMLRAVGFEVVRIERHKRIVSLRYLLRKGMSLFGPLAFIGRILGLPFGNVFVTVDLGDIMNVYCMRPGRPASGAQSESNASTLVSAK